jgi:nucleoside 2-deoxyribosyltransferase
LYHCIGDVAWERKMKIYVARPFTGYSGAELLDYYDKMKNLLVGLEVLSPMTGKEFLGDDVKLKAHGFENPVATNHAIFERDQWMVRRADIVLVDLSDGDEEAVSIGCVMELAWASLLGKHTVVVMSETSPHYHAFVLEAADIIFPTIEKAIDYFRGESEEAEADRRREMFRATLL